MTQWIDFKALRSELKFDAVFRHYDVIVVKKGEQAQGFCPLPGHGGQKRSPSFSANLRRGIWQCFGCGARGNVLDFAIRMEGLSPDNTQDVRKVAFKLCEAFQIDALRDKPQGSKPSTPEDRRKSTQVARLPEGDAPQVAKPTVRINEPLDFELKGLQMDHPYLATRGFTAQTVRHFGLGYCTRGLMVGRIVIPLHDASDRLVGYAGRITDDSKISAEVPKYKFPSNRERHGVLHEFHKSMLLYNAQTIPRSADHVIVVEGFPSVWWMHQAGIQNVVALMGASCSTTQAEVLCERTTPAARVIILSDGDAAGDRCAHSIFEAVAVHRSVRWVRLAEGRQPTEYHPAEFKQLLGL